MLINQIVNPSMSNMIRWQNHWHVVRQSWTFFQNDFAGRIANRVMQTGPSLRESLVMAFDAAWYIVVYGSSALVLLASVDWRLTPPILLWFVRLRRHPVLFRAAPARTLARGVRDALEADRARGGQLHQHPDGEAVLPRARRGRVRARGDRPAHRRIPRPDADDHRLRRDAVADECDADRLHRVAGDLAVERRAHLARRRWRWCCRCPGRSPTWPAGWRAASPRSSRISAPCRTACARSRSSGRCPIRRTRANSASRAARSASRTCISTTAACRIRGAAACCTASTCASRPASGSGWSGHRARASPRWSTCCCISTTRSAAAS